LLVEKVIGQLDLADHHIGGDERVGVFDAFLKGFVIRSGLATELAEAFAVTVLLGPPFRAAQPQEVAAVFKQFTQAGAGHTSELDFGFLGNARGFAPFEDILPSRSRGLYHLVVSAVGFS
jgi:hypothetical protein